MRRTVAEIVNEWVEESSLTLLVKVLVTLVILTFLIIHGIILMVVVVRIAKIILKLMAMFIQLNVQWLRRSAVPGQDQTQQL
jgi:hypothetical protein